MLLLPNREIFNFIESKKYKNTNELISIFKKYKSNISKYKTSYQMQIIWELKRNITDLVPNDIIENFLTFDKEEILEIKKNNSEKVWDRISNKKIFSLEEHKILIENLLLSKKEEFQLLGILASTGRRYSEICLENFEIDKSNLSNLLFKGQLKKRNIEKEIFSIPIIGNRKLIIELLSSFKEKKININLNEFYKRTLKVCHKIFNHKIHSLRSKYISFILEKEGIFNKESLMDPLVRAKELLGHEIESDATFSYKEYAINENIFNEKKLEDKIFFIKEFNNFSVSTGRKYLTNNLDYILNTFFKKEHLFLDWLDFQKLYLNMYYQKYNKKLWKQKLKKFYYQKKEYLPQS